MIAELDEERKERARRLAARMDAESLMRDDLRQSILRRRARDYARSQTAFARGFGTGETESTAGAVAALPVESALLQPPGKLGAMKTIGQPGPWRLPMDLSLLARDPRYEEIEAAAERRRGGRQPGEMLDWVEQWDALKRMRDSSGAMQRARYGERPPTEQDWLLEEGELRKRLREKAEPSPEDTQRGFGWLGEPDDLEPYKVPGLHRPALGDQDITAMLWEHLKAREAGKQAELPWYVRVPLSEGPAVLEMLAGGAGLRAAARPLARMAPGLARAPVLAKGAAEMAVLDAAMQGGRMASGAQDEFSLGQAATSSGAFGIASSLGHSAMQAVLKNRMAKTGLQAMNPAIQAEVIGRVGSEAAGGASPLVLDLMGKVERARAAASAIGVTANQASFMALQDAVHDLTVTGEQVKDEPLVETVARGAVDIGMALLSRRAFPAEATSRNAADAARKLAGLNERVVDAILPQKTFEERVRAVSESVGVRPLKEVTAAEGAVAEGRRQRAREITAKLDAERFVQRGQAAAELPGYEVTAERAVAPIEPATPTEVALARRGAPVSRERVFVTGTGGAVPRRGKAGARLAPLEPRQETARRGELQADIEPLIYGLTGARIRRPGEGRPLEPLREAERAAGEPGGFQKASAALAADMAMTGTEDQKAFLASRDSVGRYAKAFGLDGVETALLLRFAEELYTSPGGRTWEDVYTEPPRQPTAPRIAPRLDLPVPPPRGSSPAPRTTETRPLRPLAAPVGAAPGARATVRSPEPPPQVAQAAKPAAAPLGEAEAGTIASTLARAAITARRAGDTKLSERLLEAHRKLGEGLAIGTEDVRELAQIATELEAAGGRAPKEGEPAAEYAALQRELATKITEALERGTGERMEAAGRAAERPPRTEGERLATRRAAEAVELGIDAALTTASGEQRLLGPDELAALARRLRSGEIAAEVVSAGGRLGISIALPDGSTVRISRPEGESASARWRTLADSIEKTRSQQGAAIIGGSSPAEKAFTKEVEQTLADEMFRVTNSRTMRPLLGILSRLVPDTPGKTAGGDLARRWAKAFTEAIPRAFGYQADPGLAKILQPIDRSFDTERIALAGATGRWDGFLRSVPKSLAAELERSLVLAEELGGDQGLSRFRPDVVARGKRLLGEILDVADMVGERLLKTGRLAQAIYENPAGGADIVVQAGESYPPNRADLTLKGGIDFYKGRYLTHALGHAFLAKLQASATENRPGGLKRLIGFGENLRAGSKSFFRGRKLTSKEFYEKGGLASAHPTLETLVREIEAAREAEQLDALSGAGYLVESKQNPARDVDQAAVDKAKAGLLTRLKHTEAAIETKAAQFDGLSAKVNLAAKRKTFAELQLLHRTAEALEDQLSSVDAQASPWRQLLGDHWGKYQGQWLRADAFNQLMQKRGATHSWVKALLALTSAEKTLRVGHGGALRPLGDLVANMAMKSDVLGADVFAGQQAEAFRDTWNYLFKGEMPKNPIFQAMVARGAIEGAGGSGELVQFGGTTRRAIDALSKAVEERRHGDAFAHAIEAMAHAAREWPEKLPAGVGTAFRGRRLIHRVADIAPFVAYAYQTTSGKHSRLGRPISVDEAILRGGRYFQQRHANPFISAMRLVMSYSGYPNKVVEALLGPPVRPRLFGVLPLPVGPLAKAGSDPYSAKARTAYAAYKSAMVGTAILNHLTPYALLGMASAGMFVPDATEDEIETAKDNSRALRGRNAVSRAFLRPLLIPTGRDDRGDITFLNLAPSSWIGAVAEQWSGWGDVRKFLLGNVVASQFTQVFAGINFFGEQMGAGERASKVVTPLLPGIAQDAVSEAIRQWADREKGDVIPWPRSIASVLSGFRVTAGPDDAAEAEFWEGVEDGRFERAPGDWRATDPADVAGQRLLRERSREYRKTPAWQKTRTYWIERRQRALEIKNRMERARAK